MCMISPIRLNVLVCGLNGAVCAGAGDGKSSSSTSPNFSAADRTLLKQVHDEIRVFDKHQMAWATGGKLWQLYDQIVESESAGHRLHGRETTWIVAQHAVALDVASRILMKTMTKGGFRT